MPFGLGKKKKGVAAPGETPGQGWGLRSGTAQKTGLQMSGKIRAQRNNTFLEIMYILR